MIDSQSFSQFITERAIRKSEDYDILYFDEIIKAKLNRSKLKLSKELTSFLDVSKIVILVIYISIYIYSLILMILVSLARNINPLFFNTTNRILHLMYHKLYVP